MRVKLNRKGSRQQPQDGERWREVGWGGVSCLSEPPAEGARRKTGQACTAPNTPSCCKKHKIKNTIRGRGSQNSCATGRLSCLRREEGEWGKGVVRERNRHQWQDKNTVDESDGRKWNFGLQPIPDVWEWWWDIVWNKSRNRKQKKNEDNRHIPVLAQTKPATESFFSPKYIYTYIFFREWRVKVMTLGWLYTKRTRVRLVVFTVPRAPAALPSCFWPHTFPYMWESQGLGGRKKKKENKKTQTGPGKGSARDVRSEDVKKSVFMAASRVSDIKKQSSAVKQQGANCVLSSERWWWVKMHFVSTKTGLFVQRRKLDAAGLYLFFFFFLKCLWISIIHRSLSSSLIFFVFFLKIKPIFHFFDTVVFSEAACPAIPQSASRF